MKKNLQSHLIMLVALAPATVTATGATAGVSTKEGEALSFAVQTGAMNFTGSNKISLTMQHSDDGTAYTNCAALDMHNPEDGANGIVKVLDGTEDQNTVHLLSYRGIKPFVRLNNVVAGTVSVPLAVTAIKGALKQQGTI